MSKQPVSIAAIHHSSIPLTSSRTVSFHGINEEGLFLSMQFFPGRVERICTCTSCFKGLHPSSCS